MPADPANVAAPLKVMSTSPDSARGAGTANPPAPLLSKPTTKIADLAARATVAKVASRSQSINTASSPTSAASLTNAPTPSSSTCSTAPPIAFRPNAVAKPAPLKTGALSKMTMASVISPTPGTPSSVNQPITMTSKEWVIPPRPKPGRKPATDTPPTKRKAQNRAAQRAFRERRAARIGELEEQLDEQKEEHDRMVQELQEKVRHLEIESQTLQSRCHWLEDQLEKERQGRQAVGRNGDGDAQSNSSRSGSISSLSTQQTASALARSHQPHLFHWTNTKGSVPLAGPRPTAPQPFSISQIISPPESSDVLDLSCGSCGPDGNCACANEALESAAQTLSCGKCSLGSRCQCLEDNIGSTDAVPLKRPRPPPSPTLVAPEEKRQRSDAGIVMETDFTAMFASKKRAPAPVPTYVPLPPPTQNTILASVEPKDSCGFCKDGTYCVCADAMNTGPVSAPIVSQQTQTPPPSEHDVAHPPMEFTSTGAVKLPSLQSLQNARAQRAQPLPPPARAGGCGPNGPGTCAQCLSDPISGLFCRSLAANLEKNGGGSGGGCCGNGGPGGCCKDRKPEAAAPAPPRPAPSALSISCADAYKTLSSHRHFGEAADDIGTWLPKLRVAPVAPEPGMGRGVPVQTRLAPMEVEAASIMSVLKGFDVRFGRGQ